jgi:hypothetical protein
MADPRTGMKNEKNQEDGYDINDLTLVKRERGQLKSQ